MTPVEIIHAAALRLADTASHADASVLRHACSAAVWPTVRTTQALAGVARLLAALRANLTLTEIAAVRLIQERARAGKIDGEAELRRLRVAAPAAAPTPAPAAAVQHVAAIQAAPTGDRLDVELQGHRVRIRFNDNSRGKKQIIAALRAAHADFRSRSRIEPYWLMAVDELPDLARRVRATGWFDCSSLDRALLRLAAVAEERRAMVEHARALQLRLPPGCTPYAHQDAGIRFLLGRHSALLADDMGLGKTIQSVVAAETAVPRGEQILVVAPATLLYNWLDEIKKWAPPGTTARIATPTGGIPHSRWVVVSYDSAKQTKKSAIGVVDSELRAAVVGRAWPLVVLDEAHNVKNADSARHKLAADLRWDRLWMLTGTPMANRPFDLWGLLVVGRHALSADKIRYGQKFCQGHRGEYGWDFRGASNLPELSTKLSDWMLRREKNDVLDLPPKIRSTQRCTVPRHLASATYADIGAMMHGRAELAVAKVAATLERVEDVLDAEPKVVVFSESISALDAMQRKLASHGVVRIDGSVAKLARNDIVKRFQADPSIRVFLGQTVAAGSGITLTAATTVIFNDLSLVPAYHAQAEDRAYRIGTTQRVTVHYMLADARLDAATWQMLRDKIDTISKFEDGLGDSDAAVTSGARALLAALQRA